MSRVVIILLMCSQCLALSSLQSQFSAGEMSPLLEGRTDIERYYDGCRTLENMVVVPQGGAIKRPGTQFIRTYSGEIVESSSTTVGEYPTLQELTAAEIPTIPTEPSDTALVSPTDVSDKAGLQAITGSGHYNITADINCAGAWTPIADFNGVVEGNGHKISNLTLSSASAGYFGLFANLNTSAEIRNLTIDNASITALHASAIIGVLAGYCESNSVTIKNIKITNSVTNGHDRVGGILGKFAWGNKLNMFHCSVSDCNIAGRAGVGSLIGELYNGNNNDSYVVDCNAKSGIVNGNRETTANYNSSSIGGLFGACIGSFPPEDSNEVIVYNCFSEVNVATIGAINVGDITGAVDGLTQYINCHSTGNVTINNVVGGTNYESIGGFVGNESTYTIYINCYSTGNVTVNGTTSGAGVLYVGGFIGYADWTEVSHILRCYSTSNITVNTSSDGTLRSIGGFIGELSTTDETGTSLIERSWSAGDITVSDETGYYATFKGGIGGFIGTVDALRSGELYPYAATILNCYSWGQIISANSEDGAARAGFIGTINASSDLPTIVTNCYDAQTETAAGSGYTNQIPSGSYAGGLIAYVIADNSSTTTNSFWDTTTSGISASDGGVGHITSWMQTKANYQAAGWNFTTIWVLDETTTVESNSTPIAENMILRLIPYEYSAADSYILGFGDKFVGFFRTSDTDSSALSGTTITEITTITITSTSTSTATSTATCTDTETGTTTDTITCTVTGTQTDTETETNTDTETATSTDTQSQTVSILSIDPNCVALYRFENGALTTDSIGTNTLVASASSPTSDTVNYKEGAGSADFELDSSQYFYKTDTSLSAGFPLKNGDTNKKMSLCMWCKFESLPSSGGRATLYSKWDGAGLSFAMFAYNNSGNTRIEMNFGYNNGNSSEAIVYGTNIAAGKWYHIGFAMDDSDRSYRLRIWDDTAGAPLAADLTGNYTNAINVEGANLWIGSTHYTIQYRFFDGLLDELVVFNDVLTADDMDAVRAQSKVTQTITVTETDTNTITETTTNTITETTTNNSTCTSTSTGTNTVTDTCTVTITVTNTLTTTETQ